MIISFTQSARHQQNEKLQCSSKSFINITSINLTLQSQLNKSISRIISFWIKALIGCRNLCADSTCQHLSTSCLPAVKSFASGNCSCRRHIPQPCGSAKRKLKLRALPISSSSPLLRIIFHAERLQLFCSWYLDKFLRLIKGIDTTEQDGNTAHNLSEL